MIYLEPDSEFNCMSIEQIKRLIEKEADIDEIVFLQKVIERKESEVF